MHKLFRNFIFNQLILSFTFSAVACGSAFAQIKNTNKGANRISAGSVAGHYEYNTVKKGEGYVNSLDVENEGAVKLSVAFVADYVYRANGEETLHETEASGDARLNGSTASANITDESDKNCRATIVFTETSATVKVPAACRFNVALDGVYKKMKPKAAAKSADSGAGAAKTKRIAFAELVEIAGDFDTHRAGERYVVENVPAAKIESVEKSEGNLQSKGFYELNFAEGGDVRGDEVTNRVEEIFLTSRSLAKSVQANKDFAAATLRVAATLVEVSGGGDVYRCWFVTKVEGLGENGETMWTATGENPAKVLIKY